MVCAPSSVTMLVTLGTAVGRALCVIRKMKGFSMPAEVLARARHGRLDGILLLLT